MHYYYEAEIHVARANIRALLGFADEAAAELRKAVNLSHDAGHDSAYSGSGYYPDLIHISECLLESSGEGYGDGMEHREWDEDQRIEDEIIAARKAALKEAYPDMEKHGGLWVYCPNGHNTVFSPTGMDECAGCGAVMTPDDESYYDALCRAGQCM